MGRLLLWLLSAISVVGIWYSADIHAWLLQRLPFYHLASDNLLQVILAVLAGILATKASDSSRELKRLLRVTEIESLLKRADEIEGRTEAEKERYQEEHARYRQLVNLVRSETEKQFARDMLIQHTKQLTSHWEQILTLQAILTKEEVDQLVDPRTISSIQKYIIRTRYLQYMGRGFLANVPLIGGLLDYLLGPLWDYWYLRNIGRLQILFTKIDGPNKGADCVQVNRQADHLTVTPNVIRKKYEK